MELKKFACIDMAKGIAILMVFIVHFNQSFFKVKIPFFSYFQMGCQLFFVISGFGIAFSLSKRFSSHETKRMIYSKYLSSRFWAFVPAWHIMLAVYFGLTLSAKFAIGSQVATIRFIGALCNAFFLHGLLPFCHNNIVPGAWYIGTSVILYAIAPFLFLFFAKHQKRKYVICIFLSVTSLLILWIISHVFRNDELWLSNNSFGYHSFLTQFPCFCLGMLLFFVTLDFMQYDCKKLFNIKKEALLYITSTIFLLLSIVVYFFVSWKYSFICAVTLTGIASYFLLSALLKKEICSQKSKCVKFLSELGKLSYYVYLVHFLYVWFLMKVVHYIARYCNFTTDTHFFFCLFFCVCLFMSWWSAKILSRISLFVKGKIYRQH